MTSPPATLHRLRFWINLPGMRNAPCGEVSTDGAGLIVGGPPYARASLRGRALNDVIRAERMRGHVARWERLPFFGVRAAVTGGRDYADRGFVWDSLDEVQAAYGVESLVHGGATGLDTLADAWADSRGVPCFVEGVTREEWRRIGPRAGPLRNRRILELHTPDVLVAFPGGRGTADMTRAAAAFGCAIWEPAFAPLARAA